MADNTIKEFLVGLGFKIDEAGWSRFESTILKATLQAKLLGDAIEAMAKSVVSHIANVADSFDRLYWQTQRMDASVASIRAFAYAVSQMGGTVGAANSSLQAFGDFMRATPGNERFIQQFGVATRDAQGHLIDQGQVLLNIGKRLGEIAKTGPAGQALADQYAAQFGIDRETELAIERPGTQRYYQQGLSSAKSAGINNEASESAKNFQQAFDEAQRRLSDFAEGAEAKLMAALIGPLKSLDDYLDQHKDTINEELGKIAKSLVDAAEGWTKGIGTIDWAKAENGAKDLAEQVAGLVKDFANFSKALADNLPLLKALLSALLGARLGGALFGAPGAIVGGIGGAAAPFIIDHETDPNGAHSTDPGLWGAIKGWWGRNAPRALGGGGVSQAETTGNQAALAKESYDFWRSQGLSHDAALAALGNERGENVLGGHALGDGGSAMGSFQWHEDRRQDILAGTGIDIATAGHLDQLRAARWEMEHGKGGGHVWQALTGARSREEAMDILVRRFEVSSNQDSDIATRLGYANQYEPVVKGDGARRAAPGGHIRIVDPTGYSTYPAPGETSAQAATLPWDDTGAPGWGAINNALPIGGGSSVGDKNLSVNQTNNVTVTGVTDPSIAAHAVGSHLDRSSADVARNLRSAAQ